MSEKHGSTQESGEPSFDAFKPVARDTPSSGQESIFSTGSWPAASIATAAPEPSPVPAGPAGRRRMPRLIRATLLLVAAVALVAVTVGVQWWDRSAWIAQRYPAEVVKDVPRGQSAALHGMSWQASLAVRARSAGDHRDATSLIATVRVTPISAKDVGGYLPPRFEARDRGTGRRWQALPAETPTGSDLEPGRTTSFIVVAAVPNELKDTAELVLSYSSAETLRFAR
ncbi:hypothetical protein GCM10022226_77410 [Sphaerisporangium flaviroseum]|uniref:DUF4352 domain-containing protein n=1 Tax=Sphaerisporangium flaviroseum TaxID=509199 RepID=A0ABP7JEE6_9ACTN